MIVNIAFKNLKAILTKNKQNTKYFCNILQKKTIIENKQQKVL